MWTTFRLIRDRNPDNEYEPVVLARHLQALECHGWIMRARTDNQEKVPLPVAVWLQPTGPAQPQRDRMPRWHHDLYYLAYEWPNATSKQRNAYRAVNDWLQSDPDVTPVPLRERALEIFGLFGTAEDFPVPEKTFDSLKSGPLFSDSARLMSTLHAFAIHPPLLAETFLEEIGDGFYQKIGVGDVLLVVENSATWWSIVHSLPEHHRLGYVAWGLGNTFVASINSITQKHGVAEIRYFGDLDLSGLRIPHSASKIAAETGLPPVRPTFQLYATLQRLGRNRPAKERKVDRSEAAVLASWLPEPHRDHAIQLLVEGERLAQEWVGFRYLHQSADWNSDIR